MPRKFKSSDFVRQVLILAQTLNIDAILVQTDSQDDFTLINALRGREKIVWLTPQIQAQNINPTGPDEILTLSLDSIRGSAIRSMGLLLACLRGIIKPKENILCLYSSIARKELDSLTITRPKDRLRIIRTMDLETIGRLFAPEVFIRLVNILTRFATEGREGRPIGTIFVLGEPDKLQPYLKEMILNPCKGHPPELRNVFNNSFFETFRELSALDGAFVINRQGIVEGAGIYLSAPETPTKLSQGLGARHAAAAAITKHADCITMVLSESSGNISIFHDSEALFEIELHQGREWRFT